MFDINNSIFSNKVFQSYSFGWKKDLYNFFESPQNTLNFTLSSKVIVLLCAADIERVQ